ncbi:MAG: hypothetical protein ACE5JB_02975 [bacterium]
MNQNHKSQHKEIKMTQTLPIADIISLETVVNILVRKGICTPEELFEEEKRRQQYNQNVKDISVVQTGKKHTQRDDRSHRNQQSWLKRKMSKRRWTRRLGTALFGWKWKKVKVANKTMNNIDDVGVKPQRHK